MMKILTVVIFIGALAKDLNITMIFKEFGLLTRMLTLSFKKVIPVITIFISFSTLFAFIQYILETNKEELETFKELPEPLAQFFIAFGNGIGSIIQPTYPTVFNGERGTAIDHALMATIYAVWFSNKLICLIVLLNYVIAVLSDVYDYVMDS
jgi:hypothetical protein